MATIEELKKDRKEALIAICTLGLSSLPWKVIFEGANSADKGTSFEGNVVGWIIKVFFFFLFAVFGAVFGFVINLFKLIYYLFALHGK